MKVGEYVRTPYGIRKVKDIRIKSNYLDDGFYVEDRFIVCGHKAMQEVISSPNIIDLIEVGDYVNGVRVDEIKNGEIRTSSHYDGYICNLCDEEDIKSIVTKEQFESIEYKVGEKE